MRAAVRMTAEVIDAPAHAAQIARIGIHDSLGAAERDWRLLEAADTIATPYQRFDWIEPWQRHVGETEGVELCIVTAYGECGTPLLIWPLGVTRKGPLRVGRFLGGKHANFNMPLVQRTLAKAMTKDDLRRVFNTLSAHRLDVLSLHNQPERWDGVANPVALMPHQPSPSNGFRLRLKGTGDEVIERQLSSAMRGRLRTKERKLAKLPGYRYVRATEPADVDRHLDAFFAQKSVRLKEQGLDDAFGDPAVAAFLRDTCHRGLQAGRPVIEIHVLECDGEVLAFCAGVNDGRRFSSMINSYTLSEHARWSPGLILLQYMVKDCADRGLRMFDLGVGEAHYKTFFCNEAEPLFDSFVPLRPLGRLAAAAARTGYDMKRRIKRSPRLWAAVQTTRRLFGVPPLAAD